MWGFVLMIFNANKKTGNKHGYSNNPLFQSSITLTYIATAFPNFSI